MKVVGFNFTKMSVEKDSDKFENLKINTKIDITDVNQVKSDVFQAKENLIEIKFSYIINYDPKIAKISFAGNLLVLVDEKTSKKFQKEWKNKKFPEEHKILLFNVILKKSNLKALQLEDEMNLPLHIALPSVKEIKQN
jgi:hypothetical protein